jgi:hypothetical protein
VKILVSGPQLYQDLDFLGDNSFLGEKVTWANETKNLFIFRKN